MRGRLLVGLIAGGLVLAGCGGGEDSAVTTTSSATAATTSPATTTTSATTNEESTTTTAAPEAVVLAPLPPGDAAAGESLFNMPMQVRLNDACSTCHSTAGAEAGWGPVLDGIGAVAGDRVEGLSTEGYLHESIIAPRAYGLEGWQLVMPGNYAEILAEQDIADLIAYLLEV
jgi:mono/diheme cytochrome c family protein